MTAVIGDEFLHKPVAVQVQFRYAFVCDEEGVKVLDITDLAQPAAASRACRWRRPHNIYLARTYAYVAGGKAGLIILDIENPEQPRIDQIYNADGCINDLHDVKLGITYASEFAYLADGKNGLRVVQLTSPETPGNYGFSPRPTPRADRHVQDAQGRRGAGHLQGRRSRPGRRRIRQPDRRLRPRRRPAAQLPGAAEALLSQRPGLARERRSVRSAVSRNPARDDHRAGRPSAAAGPGTPSAVSKRVICCWNRCGS